MPNAKLSNQDVSPAEVARCPMRELITRLGDKWSMLVIVALAHTPSHCLRFSHLMQEVNGISQRMLTTTLRHLERDGIVSRKVFPQVPPRVDYTLTARGAELLVPVRALVSWIEGEWPGIEQSRSRYDRALSVAADTNATLSKL